MTFIQSRTKSIKHAFEGLLFTIKYHPNIRIHFVAALVVTIVGVLVDITREDWLIVWVMICLVIVIELLNTAIEETLDYLALEHHISVKTAKDVSAAAVLFVSIAAVIVGVVVFYPYFL